jgi:hypothetical protein
MRERFRACEEAESRNRERATESLRFYFGEQWADEIERQRMQDGRPCFTLNKLPAIVKQVLNESRQNRPAIQINPVSDGADEDTAEAIQGLTRHVEANSDADVVYESAFEYMVISGFGSWRILTEYLPKSFNQEIFVKRVPNPFSVYWDPDAKELDKSDAKYAFITHDFSRDAFKDAFPDSEISGLNDFSGLGDQAPGWLHSDGCRVVEYFYIEAEEKQLLQLQDGSVAWEDELPKGAVIAKQAGKPISRKATRNTAYACKSNGVEWLEDPKPLPTDDIPIVTIFGDQLVIDGETRVKGMVHDAKEAQRLFNYNSSAIAETMALGTKANWLVTPKQIENFGPQWAQANSRNQAFLPYNPDPQAGGPPSKIATEPPIQAMSAARLQSADDLRSITGVYDSTQVPNSGEESGKAILARRHQTATGNLNFSGNLARGIKRTAKILLKYFPVIYDTARVMRIVGSDMQPKQVMVHSGQPESVPPQLPDGIKGVFDLTVGTYDVTVSVGPSFDSKRQEATDMLLTLVGAEPALAPIIGDLIVNQMDFSGKQAIVDRLQKALPPGLQDQQNPTDPKQLAAHNTMLMQQNQQLMQQVQKITQMLQTKQVESQARLQVESIKLQAQQIRSQAEIEQANTKAQADILVHGADKHLQVVHDHAMADKNHIHAVAMANHNASLQPEPTQGGE